jgi:hypothetical protein
MTKNPLTFKMWSMKTRSPTFRGTPCPQGHEGLRYVKSRACVACIQARNHDATLKAARKAAAVDYYQKNRQRHLDYVKQYRDTPKGRALQLYAAARHRSKAKGIPVTITIEWIEEQLKLNRCAVTGLPFDWKPAKRQNPYSPSLDRIDSLKGYEPGNCRVVLFAVNTACGAWGEQVFREIATAWIAHQANPH